MAQTTNPNWDNSWTTTSINASSITNTGNATSGAISNDNKSATEVSVEIVYGGTANKGAMVYLLRDIDGTNYESVNDSPFAFEMPSAVSSTRRKSITVQGNYCSGFKVYVENNTGAGITATVRTKQATTDSL